MDWLMLKSGSDVRGTAVGEGTVLTEDIAKALGTAFVKKLCVDKGKKAEDITISLGRDSRISGPGDRFRYVYNTRHVHEHDH